MKRRDSEEKKTEYSIEFFNNFGALHFLRFLLNAVCLPLLLLFLHIVRAIDHVFVVYASNNENTNSKW